MKLSFFCLGSSFFLQLLALLAQSFFLYKFLLRLSLKHFHQAWSLFFHSSLLGFIGLLNPTSSFASLSCNTFSLTLSYIIQRHNIVPRRIWVKRTRWFCRHCETHCLEHSSDLEHSSEPHCWVCTATPLLKAVVLADTAAVFFRLSFSIVNSAFHWRKCRLAASRLEILSTTSPWSAVVQKDPVGALHNVYASPLNHVSHDLPSLQLH